MERSTAELEAEAVESWLVRFADQPFSLTDAVSFTVMTIRGIEEALTLDHHFTVAGFVACPAGSADEIRGKLSQVAPLLWS